MYLSAADRIASTLTGRLLPAVPTAERSETAIITMADDLAETVADALIERYGQDATWQIIEILFPVS